MNSKQNTFIEKEISLIDLFYKSINILFSLRKTILVLLAISLIIGFLSTGSITPKFTANTKILIEPKNENLKNEQNIDFSSLNQSSVQTEIEIMRSSAFIQNVIDKTSLEIPTYQISSENSSVITRTAYYISKYSGLQFLLKLFSKSAIDIKKASISKGIDIALDAVVNNVDANKVDEIFNKITTEYDLTSMQKERLEQFVLDFQSGNPPSSDKVMQFAYSVLKFNGYSDAEILRLAREYLPENIRLNDDQLIAKIDQYKNQTDLGTSVNQENLKNNNKSIEITSLEPDELSKDDYFDRTKTTNFELSKISWVRSNLNIYKDKNSNLLNVEFSSVDPFISVLLSNEVAKEYLSYQRISKESAGFFTAEYYQEKVDELRTTQEILSKKILKFEKDNEFYNTKVDDLESEINQSQNELRDLQLNKNEKLKIFKIKHPEIIKILDNEKILINRINELNFDVNQTRAIQSQLSDYISEKDVNDQLIATYLNKLLSVSSFNQSDAKIMENAEKAQFINRNDAFKRIIISAFVTIILVIIYSLFIVLLDIFSLKNRIQLISQIKDHTKKSSLGTIPHLKDFILQQTKLSKEIFENKFLEENLKKILLTLKSNAKFRKKTYLISSSSTAEGKTSVTFLLGHIASQLNKKVLLIDMDVEKASLSNIHNIKNNYGFYEYLNNKTKRISTSKLIMKTKNKYDIIPAGNKKGNQNLSFEQVNTKKFMSLIRILEKKYDYIFCDSMPLNYQPELIPFTALINTILTVRHNKTSVSSLKFIMSEYNKMDLDQPQTLFNDIDFKSSRVFRMTTYNSDELGTSGYGYGYGYGYDYGYGYGYSYSYGANKKVHKNIFDKFIFDLKKIRFKNLQNVNPSKNKVFSKIFRNIEILPIKIYNILNKFFERLAS